MENKISEILRTSLEQMKEAVDANTVIGEPITATPGITILPVSKITVGTASGGLDYFGKNLPATEKNTEKLSSFGGGGGVGMNVEPIGFLVVREGGRVEFIGVAATGGAAAAVTIVDTVTDLIDRSPALIEKLKVTFGKGDKSEKKDSSPEA